MIQMSTQDVPSGSGPLGGSSIGSGRRGGGVPVENLPPGDEAGHTTHTTPDQVPAGRRSRWIRAHPNWQEELTSP